MAAAATARRSIRVLVSPTPLSFAERRSVLQVLEQHGPIEAFLMTPGYRSNFVSLTREPATASRLIANSPLTYSLPASHPDDKVEADGPDGVKGRADAATADGSPPPAPRQFQLDIFPEPDYNHKYSMLGSPLYRSWPECYRQDKSLMATTLTQSLPTTMAAQGLSHWLFPLGESPAALDRTLERLRRKQCLPSKMKQSTSKIDVGGETEKAEKVNGEQR